MAISVAAGAGLYAFDDRNINWSKLGDFEHFELAMLDVDVTQKIADFLLKFPPNRQIFLHRHLALTSTLVIEGEHRLYAPSGALKEVRPVGSYTSSPPGDAHREGGGDAGAVVFYSVRGKDGALFEVLDDDLNFVAALSLDDFAAVLKQHIPA